MLLFCLCGVLPSTKVCDLGVQTKGEAREAIRAQCRVKMAKNASRLNSLSDELDNLPGMACRLGYPVSLFSPRLNRIYNLMNQNQMHMGMALGMPCPPVGSLHQVPGPCRLALMGGEGSQGDLLVKPEEPEGGPERGAARGGRPLREKAKG